MRIFNWHIMSDKNRAGLIEHSFNVGKTAGMRRYERIHKFIDKATINPVIHSLKELRNNTWDKERVDFAIEWLEDYMNE